MATFRQDGYLELNGDQLAELARITSDGTANFPAGYRYVYDIIRDDADPNLQGLRDFFQGAAPVNAGSGEKLKDLKAKVFKDREIRFRAVEAGTGVVRVM